MTFNLFLSVVFIIYLASLYHCISYLRVNEWKLGKKKDNRTIYTFLHDTMNLEVVCEKSNGKICFILDEVVFSLNELNTLTIDMLLLPLYSGHRGHIE